MRKARLGRDRRSRGDPFALLPPELILRILRYVQVKACRLVIPLVSKRWRAQVAGPSTLWENITVDLAPSKRHQYPALELTGGQVGTIGDGELQDPSWPRVATWLAARAPSISTLVLSCTQAPVLPSLRPVTFLSSVLGAFLCNRMTELVLLDCSKLLKRPTADSLESISWLHSLQKLTMHDLPLNVAAEGINHLGGLRSLSDLFIVFEQQQLDARQKSLRGGFPNQLSKLHRLQTLVIKWAGPEAFPNLPDCLSTLQSLQVLSLDHCGTCYCGLSISCMTSLTSLYITSWLSEVDHPIAFPATLALMQLENVILTCSEVPGAIGQCAKLRRLSLAKLDQPEDAMESAFEVLLSPLSYLEGLHLDHCRLRRLPPAVAALTCLQVLDVGCNHLETLPVGLYLQKLEVLGLYSNPLAGIPTALTGAPSLRVLDISQSDGTQEISQQDRQVLSSMPRLHDLWLSRSGAWSGASVEALCDLCRGGNRDLVVNTTEDDVHPELIWVTVDDIVQPIAEHIREDAV